MNQIESSRRITFSPKGQAPPIPTKSPTGPGPPRPSRIPVLQEWSQKTSDVQQTSQVFKPKTKVASKLDMAEQLVKKHYLPQLINALRDGENTVIFKTLEMKLSSWNEKKGHETFLKGMAQSHSHKSTFFPKELEFYKQGISSSEKINWLQAMQEQL